MAANLGHAAPLCPVVVEQAAVITVIQIGEVVARALCQNIGAGGTGNGAGVIGRIAGFPAERAGIAEGVGEPLFISAGGRVF